MANFVGLTVVVTLRQGSVIQGLVNAVDPATSSLLLHDGKVATPRGRQDFANALAQSISLTPVSESATGQFKGPKLQTSSSSKSLQHQLPRTVSMGRVHLPHIVHP
jgi:small nuclear ribonucleoprotein (snRNP)-like protein